MKKLFLLPILSIVFFLAARSLAQADWVECPVTIAQPNGTALTGSGSSRSISDADHEYIGVWANCLPDSNGLKVQFQTSAPANIYFQNTDGSFVYHSFSGTTVDSYILTDSKQISSLSPSSAGGLVFGDPGVVPVAYTHFQIFHWLNTSPSPTPSPTSTPTPIPTPTLLPTPSPSSSPASTSPSATISVSSSTSSLVVGVPFTVDMTIDGGGQAFNAAQATISVSPNLSVTSFYSPNTNPCNFQYTQAPSAASLSFAGAIANLSSTNCKVYTLALTPTAAGTGTISITNGSVKSFGSSGEIFANAVSGSYTIESQSQTSIPVGLTTKGFSLNAYPFDTYSSSITITGTKDASLTHILGNGSETGVTYPTTTTWQAMMPLSAFGANTLVFYGKDDTSNQTSSQSITVTKHILGDIDGDGVVDIVDASLFAVDWGKTSNLTYLLSDMDGDGKVDLTDFSILAKHETQL